MPVKAKAMSASAAATAATSPQPSAGEVLARSRSAAALPSSKASSSQLPSSARGASAAPSSRVPAVAAAPRGARLGEGLLLPGISPGSVVPDVARHGYSSTLRMAMNASWGTSTLPMAFIRFLPAFCFSRSLRLRVMSPP